MRRTTWTALGGFLVIPLFCAVPTRGATVTYLGMQASVNDQWRTTTLLKPLDPDGNNVYGSAGYKMFGGAASTSLPSYVSAVTPTSIYPGNGSYIAMDDPTAAPGPSVANVATGTANPQPGTGNSGTAVNITLSSAVATVPNFTLTLLNDNLDGVSFNAATFRVLSAGATTGDSGPVAVTSQDRVPDAYVFQITGAQPGDTLAVSGTGGTSGYVTVGIVAFDNLVPEPASLGLLGIGALALLGRRRRD